MSPSKPDLGTPLFLNCKRSGGKETKWWVDGSECAFVDLLIVEPLGAKR
jgi:hypothetical protein